MTQNIFVQLGFDEAEATVMIWRDGLASVIRHVIQNGPESQTAIAKRLNVRPSVLSRIVNGHLERISVEYLLTLCVRLGTRGDAHWDLSSKDSSVVMGAVSLAARTGNLTLPASVGGKPNYFAVPLIAAIDGATKSSTGKDGLRVS
jgi:predicted XRE-type DNA-binding protein